MIRIYRKSHLCASIKMLNDGAYQVSARRADRESSDVPPLQKRFDNWAEAARFLEEIAAGW